MPATSDAPLSPLALVRLAPVIPVLTIGDPGSAVDLARALVDGGLPVLEVTLRTPGALEAIAAIARAVPDAVVGAGTVLTPGQVADAVGAGSRFLVSPGCTPALLDAALASGLPFLPGIATPSEAMAAAERGLTVLKFFPAETNGGVPALKALAAPLPHLTFCPTGGIDAARAPSYLALDTVACVGGSWVTPAAALATGDWATVTRLAREASALRA